MIYAIVLAAGQSKRMGQPKMLLPWGNNSVLGHILEILQKSGIQEIVVVTGGARAEVENIASQYSVRTIYNENYANDEMLTSIQCGLKVLPPLPLGEGRGEGGRDGVLICLGDQPLIQERSVRLVCEAFHQGEANLVVPSFQIRRGHPWLVARPLWNELLGMKSPQTPRDFLNLHGREIHYVEVNTPSVLEDLDTPEDYLKFKP